MARPRTPSNPARPARPLPPEHLGEWDGTRFLRYAPALDLATWVIATFLMEDGPLYNEDHRHLLEADIAYLWAGEGHTKQGRIVLGQCEKVMFRAGGWQKGRQEFQMEEWFGHVPDFVITIDGEFARECSDMEFCALVEHELFHIAHAKDEGGAPRFNRDTGQPVLTMRGHDVEEFIGVVRRYGATNDVARLVEAASKAPEVSKINIARACGTCMVRAA